MRPPYLGFFFCASFLETCPLLSLVGKSLRDKCKRNVSYLSLLTDDAKMPLYKYIIYCICVYVRTNSRNTQLHVCNEASLPYPTSLLHDFRTLLLIVTSRRYSIASSFCFLILFVKLLQYFGTLIRRNFVTYTQSRLFSLMPRIAREK